MAKPLPVLFWHVPALWLTTAASINSIFARLQKLQKEGLMQKSEKGKVEEKAKVGLCHTTCRDKHTWIWNWIALEHAHWIPKCRMFGVLFHSVIQSGCPLCHVKVFQNWKFQSLVRSIPIPWKRKTDGTRSVRPLRDQFVQWVWESGLCVAPIEHHWVKKTRVTNGPSTPKTNSPLSRIEQTNCHWNVCQFVHSTQDELEFVSGLDAL